MAIFLKECSYLVQSPTQIERNIDVLIEGNRFTSIGRNLPHPQDCEIIDARDQVVIPGLINAHTHLYQNMMKGISEGIELVPWCNQVLFPSIDSMRKSISRNGRELPHLWTTLSAIEMIRGGVTSCINMDTIFPEIIHAWENIGFRGVLAYTLANKWVPAELRASEDAMKQQITDFIVRYHHPDGLTTVFPSPSTLFLCTDDFLQWASRLAKDNNLGMQTHIAETKDEVAEMQAETGRTPVEQLDHLGMLYDGFSAVHCVHLTPHDIDLLAASGAQMVHCPKSNMKLADGIAPLVEIRKKGIPAALATDGSASNDLLDMWEEMRAAILLARVANNNAAALSPRDAFDMATIQAARAAHLDAGQIQPGKLADIAVIDIRAPHMQPFHDQDILNMLVFCTKSSDVRHTIINGELVLKDRRITKVDEDAILQEAAALDVEHMAGRQVFLNSVSS